MLHSVRRLYDHIEHLAVGIADLSFAAASHEFRQAPDRADGCLQIVRDGIREATQLVIRALQLADQLLTFQERISQDLQQLAMYSQPALRHRLLFTCYRPKRIKSDSSLPR